MSEISIIADPDSDGIAFERRPATIGLIDRRGRYAGASTALPSQEEMRIARARQKRVRQAERQRKGMTHGA